MRESVEAAELIIRMVMGERTLVGMAWGVEADRDIKIEAKVALDQ